MSAYLNASGLAFVQTLLGLIGGLALLLLCIGLGFYIRKRIKETKDELDEDSWT